MGGGTVTFAVAADFGTAECVRVVGEGAAECDGAGATAACVGATVCTEAELAGDVDIGVLVFDFTGMLLGIEVLLGVAEVLGVIPAEETDVVTLTLVALLSLLEPHAVIDIANTPDAASAKAFFIITPQVLFPLLLTIRRTSARTGFCFVTSR